VALVVLPACGGTSSTATHAATTLVVAMEQGSLRTLDPNDGYEPAFNPFGHELYQTLVTFNTANVGDIQPAVAESWTVSSTGETWTFNLNPKAKFSDGDPVTSADVVFGLEREINLEGPGSFMLGGVQSITAPSSETVVFQLASGDFTFPSILTSDSLGIGEAKVIEAHGGTDATNASTADTAESWLDENSVGSGPYVLQSWTRGQQLVLLRNKNYWMPEPAYPKIIFQFVSSSSTEQLMLQKGSAAVAVDLSPDQIASLASNHSIGVAKASALDQLYMGWTASAQMSPVLANQDNWDAIKDAINYQSLVDVSSGAAVQAGSLVPQTLEGGLPKSDGLQRNLTKAKQALQAAGNPNGFSFTLTYGTDEFVAGIPMGILAQSVQASLAEVGIMVNLEPVLFVNFLSAYRAGTTDAVLHGWADDYPGTSDYLPLFVPGGKLAMRQQWPETASNTEMTTLSNEAFATENKQQRDALIGQALKLLNKDGPFVPLLDTEWELGYNKTLVSNVQANELWYFNFENMRPAG
jgi:peptide/nickel transport system substrate-binding protein